MVNMKTDVPTFQACIKHAEISRREFCLGGLTALTLPRSISGAAHRPIPNSKKLQPVSLDDIGIVGDLARRAYQNYDRLESDIYRPPLVFEKCDKTWSGDWEGRTVLGLTLISRSTHREARYLDEILRLYPSNMNGQGYFGPVLDVKAINEQQLSGHAWVLRGLCEYYEWKKDERIREMIDKIVRNLALSMRGKYSAYPVAANVRPRTVWTPEQAFAFEHIGDWQVSVSDVGCAFIFLDGLTHAYQVHGGADLKALIEEAIARFLQVDLVGIKTQAHATLTALRALLRHFENTGDPKLLKAVEERFALYRTQAMTETYASFNWFERPEWTEICAIIDSFMLAVQLWRYTGNAAYLEDAHLIYFNGIGRGQRNNGGYGLDTCAGARDPYLIVNTYEAPWCCTMRGGEGNARAIEYAYFSRPGELVLPFFHDSKATLKVGQGTVTLRQTTGYPYQGTVKLEVISSNLRGSVGTRFAAPSWTKSHRLRLNGKDVPVTKNNGFVEVHGPLHTGDTMVLDFDLVATAGDTFNPHSIRGYHAFHAGPLVLGYEGPSEITLPRDSELIPDEPGSFRVRTTGTRLARINDLNTLKVSEKDPCRRQVLFREA